MSSETRDDQHMGEGPGPELTSRLGYLLKHARLKLGDLTAAALAPYGLDGRELAVLLVLASCEPGIPAAGRPATRHRPHDHGRPP